MKLEIEKKLDLYRQTLRIRLVEEEIAKRYSEQEMRCPVHLSIGQEGAAAAVCASLNIDDYALSNHRSHSHYLAKGGNLRRLIAELYGKSTGCAKGYGGSMHLIDLSVGLYGCTPIVSNSIPVGVGIAFGAFLKGEKRITAVFLGDASVEEGVFHECMNFSSLHSLPVLFACENNLYSVYTHIDSRQPSRELVRHAKAHCVESYLLDGNNVFESYEKINSIITEMRQKPKPVFVQFDTYRWREHCGPNYDNHLGYRTEEEFLMWKKKDPLTIMRQNLKELNVSENIFKTMISEIQSEIHQAFEQAHQDPPPESNKIFEDKIYA